MLCPKCKRTMTPCIVGGDASSATCFLNCPHCNIQMTDDGFILAFDGDIALKSNYNVIEAEAQRRNKK